MAQSMPHHMAKHVKPLEPEIQKMTRSFKQSKPSQNQGSIGGQLDFDELVNKRNNNSMGVHHQHPQQHQHHSQNFTSVTQRSGGGAHRSHHSMNSDVPQQYDSTAGKQP